MITICNFVIREDIYTKKEINKYTSTNGVSPLPYYIFKYNNSHHFALVSNRTRCDTFWDLVCTVSKEALGSNYVSICASLGTHAYLCVQQKVCWHTSPMRTIKMLHSSMLTCITHVCSRSYISHVGMLEHSILIAPMGQHTRGFQEQNYYVMYFIKFTWFQLQNKMFHISLHTWIRPHITGWCKSA